jgi:hypothetical protein
MSKSRRTFLALSIGGAAVVAATAGVSYYLTHDKGELDELDPPEPLSETGQRFADAILEKLDMLDIPDATIAKWVNDYERYERPWTGKAPSRKDLQNFLLSTDLFPDGDEQKPLRYVAYYDPYISVCYNPLRHAS